MTAAEGGGFAQTGVTIVGSALLARSDRIGRTIVSRGQRMRFRVVGARLQSRVRLALIGAILVSTPHHIEASAGSLHETTADQFAVGERPFAASSSWNTPIPEGAIYRRVGWPPQARFGLAWSSYSPAIYVASNSDPIVSVQYMPSWGYPGGVVSVRMPPQADGAAGSDGELLVIDGARAHNFWQFKRLNLLEATARSYGVANVIIDSGWGRASPFRGAGIVATGSSQLAGMLVQAETDRGEIAHALQISIDSRFAKPGHIGEAISGDGPNPDGLLQEGQRLAIPPNLPMPPDLSPLGQKVFRAYQKYGAFVIDVAGGVTNLRAQANAYDQATISALRRDLERITPMLECVNWGD
jgi:hypothetical protein